MVHKTPRIDIIICVKNNKDIISECIDSVAKQTYKNWNCIVVDDNSKDGTCEFINSKYKFVKCIKLSGKGPAYNRNVGIKSGSGKYIATLDSDVKLTKNWLFKMVKFMEDNQTVGISGGKILCQNNPDVISIAGGGLTRLSTVYHRGHGENKNVKKYNQVKRVIYLCSASMIIRREILKKLGYFDQDYIYGYEDLDICWRANIAGFDVVYNPQAESFHQMNITINQEYTSEEIRFLGNRNRFLTLIKNYEAINFIKYSPLFFIHFLYLLIFKSHRVATIRAYLWNINNLQRTLKKRGKINNIRKRSDKDLFMFLKKTIMFETSKL